MNTKSELSLDVSDFEKLIKRNKIYVDKTKVIKRLRDLNGTYHFLSRPRRFGKSLLISTLKNLFEGKKELFKNTYIYNHWNWKETYPVITFDLSKPKTETSEKFEKSLNFYIDSIAENEFNIELKAEFSNDKLRELIDKTHKKTGKHIVVLIDEYDKPILDNLNNAKTATEIQRNLKDFYGILKSEDSKLEFVFITGITKFSKVSIFSEFKNLIQLTLKEDYSMICGYSQEEVEKYFKEFINSYSDSKNISYQETVKKIKYHYDGYSWDGKNFLYNPYSLMNFFEDNEFNNQ
ncbi:MAG: AAA family ATPase partial [Methanobrevibacter sp. CfCl-M3]